MKSYEVLLEFPTEIYLIPHKQYNLENRAGLRYIFINQVGYCDKTYLNQILTDQFVSSWYNDIENSSRGQFYGSFKKDFGLENYLVRLNEKTRIWMTKLRASNIRIPIETGRWYNIPKDERFCTLCGQSIGDEFQNYFLIQSLF
jgi:hypothetical protein